MAKTTAKTIDAPAPAAGAEPSDSDLMQLLQGGTLAVKDQDVDSEDEDIDETDEESAATDEASDDVDSGDSEPAAADSSTDDQAEDEQEADDEAEPAAELDDEDATVRAKFTPDQQKKFDRAISKKSRRIVELKTELEQAKAALETAQKAPAQPVAVDPASPLAAVEDEPALDQRIADARKLRRFALANPDGAFVDAKTGAVLEEVDPDSPPEGAVSFTKKRIGEILAETEELIQEHAPRARETIRARHAAEAEAVKEFPWLKNKGSVGTQAIEATLKAAPQLRAIPGARLLLADAFIGRQIRLAQKQQQKPGAKTGNGQGSAQKAPPSPNGARPPKVAGTAKRAQFAGDTLAKTGDDPDNAALRAIINS